MFVTHDQDEALTLSDRIAVFNEGRIVQLGTPSEIYERPVNPFVADFVGTSNLFDDALSLAVLGEGGYHSVRPEKIGLRASASNSKDVVSLPGVIAEEIYLGTATRVIVDADAGHRLVVLEQNAAARADRRGDRVVAEWSRADVVTLSTSISLRGSPKKAPSRRATI